MRMEKINDRQVKFYVSEQDLRARKITPAELKYNSRETKALFKELLNTASRSFHFNEEDLPVMIEAVPLPEGELMIIISAVEDAEELDPHFVHFSQEAAEENAEEPAAFSEQEAEGAAVRSAVFRLPDIGAVITFCKHLALFPGSTALYRGEGAHRFYLCLIRPAEMEPREFYVFLNRISEYAELLPESPLLYAFLREHDKPVMEDPHRKLAGL